MRKTFIVLVVVLTGYSVNLLAKSEQIRCGRGLVKLGMTPEKVQKTCGSLKPYSKNTYEKMFHVPNGGGEVRSYQYEVWEYHQYGKYRMYINFFQGQVNKFWVDRSIKN